METAWIMGLVGGLLIGAASAMHLLLNGRIAGTSGMMASLLRLQGDESGRLAGAFLLGAFGAALGVSALVFTPEISVTASLPALLASGLLVGAGVTLSNGCTSGHGVCGMSRLSVRSIAATLTFMAATAAVVFLTRHVMG